MDMFEIVSALRGQDSQIRVRIGTVTSTSPFTVSIGGSSTGLTGLSRLSSYSPTVSDRILCLANGTDVIVLGKLV